MENRKVTFRRVRGRIIPIEQKVTAGVGTASLVGSLAANHVARGRQLKAKKLTEVSLFHANSYLNINQTRSTKNKIVANIVGKASKERVLGLAKSSAEKAKRLSMSSMKLRKLGAIGLGVSLGSSLLSISYGLRNK